MFIVSYANCCKHRSDNTSFRLTLNELLLGWVQIKSAEQWLVGWSVGQLVGWSGVDWRRSKEGKERRHGDLQCNVININIMKTSSTLTLWRYLSYKYYDDRHGDQGVEEAEGDQQRHYLRENDSKKMFGMIVSKEIVVATTLKKVRMGLMYSLAKMTTLRKVDSPPWKTWGPVLWIRTKRLY